MRQQNKKLKRFEENFDRLNEENSLRFFDTNRVKVINLSAFMAQKKKKITWSDRVSFHEMMFGQQGKDKWASHVKPESATKTKLIMFCYHKEIRCYDARKNVNLVT